MFSIECPAGSYCPGSDNNGDGDIIMTCGFHSTSLAGSNDASDCECIMGYHGAGNGADCTLCDAGYYCPSGGNTQLSCGEGMII